MHWLPLAPRTYPLELISVRGGVRDLLGSAKQSSEEKKIHHGCKFPADYSGSC
jgi:hypothetical protein